MALDGRLLKFAVTPKTPSSVVPQFVGNLQLPSALTQKSDSVCSSAFDEVPNASAKRIDGKRLGHHMHAGFQMPVAKHRIFRIPGDEEYLEIRTRGTSCIGHLTT